IQRADFLYAGFSARTFRASDSERELRRQAQLQAGELRGPVLPHPVLLHVVAAGEEVDASQLRGDVQTQPEALGHLTPDASAEAQRPAHPRDVPHPGALALQALDLVGEVAAGDE